MRILIISHEFLGTGGGNTIDNLSKSFSKLGNNVDIITSKYDYNYTKYKNVRVYQIPIGRKKIYATNAMNMFLFIILSFLFAIKLIQKNSKYDAIQCMFIFPSGIVGLALSKIFNIPLYIKLGGDIPGWMKYRFKSLSSLTTPFFIYICNNSNKIIVNSEGMKTYLHRFIKNEITIIPPGVDLNYFLPKIQRMPNSKIKIILCVARLVPEKGIHLLLKAIQSIDEIQLRILGDGPGIKELKNLAFKLGIESKVLFLGHVPSKTLRDNYQNADLFVLPSFIDDLPTSSREALSSGLPLVISNFYGSEDLIDGNGFIVPMNNEILLEQKIRYIIKNDMIRIKMGEKSREIAIRKFDWSKISEQYLNIYYKNKR